MSDKEISDKENTRKKPVPQNDKAVQNAIQEGRKLIDAGETK